MKKEKEGKNKIHIYRNCLKTLPWLIDIGVKIKSNDCNGENKRREGI